MIRTVHTSILRANKGELEALVNLDARTVGKVSPLFEITPLTEAIRQDRAYMRKTTTPVLTYLNRKLDPIAEGWGTRRAMVDGFQWAPDAHVETGDHLIAYMVSRLRSLGVDVVPVIGYDRWDSTAYRLGIKGIVPRSDGTWCLRLDRSAVEDAAEPEYFRGRVADIVEELELQPEKCFVILDFADISSDATPLELLVSSALNVIGGLETFHFDHYVTVGCSLPPTINLAVSKRDAVGAVLRKEMLLWQTLRLEYPQIRIESGDYGVRGPTTTEQPSKYTNGKIRHTVKQQTFVARGHPFRDDGGRYVQMHGLAATVVRSTHFLGGNFSWGDDQIVLCSRFQALGALSRWIAIDTNHHLTFVVQEVEEFERELIGHMPIMGHA